MKRPPTLHTQGPQTQSPQTQSPQTQTLQSLKEQAHQALSPAAWAYYQGSAGSPELDAQCWSSVFLVPRVLRGLTGVDTTTTLGGTTLATPVMIAATAAHRLAHPNGELATAAGAAAAGALMVYSSSAAVEVTEFGAGAPGPWWAQVYVMTDRGVTYDYVDRCVAAGTRALLVTVDYPGAVARSAFRVATAGRLDATPGNYPQWSWPEMTAAIDPALTPDVIGELAQHSGLPIHVKGVLHPDDASIAVGAGAAGIVVSNHGRRQVDGVLPTCRALPAVVEAVAGDAIVTVDGGIRGGVDVLRALAMGAQAVGVGRPVLWGLAAAGPEGVGRVLDTVTAELRQAMASVGAGTVRELDSRFIEGNPGLLGLDPQSVRT
jgi:4-hydroxymandelate oxidase